MNDALATIHLKNQAFSYMHLITHNPDDHQHKSYLQDRYQLYYLISGSVTYQVENHGYELKPGDLILLNNKEMHRPYFTSNDRYERILIFFTPEFCSHYSQENYSILQHFEKRRPGSLNLLPGSVVGRESLVSYFTEIEEHIKKNLPESKTLIEITFIRLLIHINSLITSRQNTCEPGYDYNRKMEQIIGFINVNFHRPLTLEEIEETFFINKFYFSHLFKKITGFSFKEYIIRKRITKASQLLRLAVPPSEACRMSGFEDYSNFYKAFKRIVGVSPSKY